LGVNDDLKDAVADAESNLKAIEEEVNKEKLDNKAAVDNAIEPLKRLQDRLTDVSKGMFSKYDNNYYETKAADKVRNLEEGDHFMLSTGWSGSEESRGHANLVDFKKVADGNVEITLLDTGVSSDKVRPTKDGKRLEFPAYTYTKDELGNGELEAFMKSLMN